MAAPIGQKKKKNLPFATAWMNLENIMLSEINQSEKDKYHMTSLIRGFEWAKKLNRDQLIYREQADS